jgi:hypothetical protein
VGAKFKTSGGWSVEVVELESGEWLRVRHHGFWVADVRTTEELAAFFPLEDLEEALSGLRLRWS